MLVKILANLIYRGEIFVAGKSTEIDDISARLLEKRGAVKIISGGEVEEFTPVEGLPDLVVENAGKKKK